MPPPPQKSQISRLNKLKQLNKTLSKYSPELENLAGHVVWTLMIWFGVIVAVIVVMGLIGGLLYLLFLGVKAVFF
jgi:hypothetical protein